MSGDMMGGSGKVDRRAAYDPSGWVIPYADLMTTLMIFFLLLYSVGASGNSDKLLANVQESVGGKKNAEAEQKANETKAAEQLSQELKDSAIIEINAQRIKIQMPAPVLFDTGKADLKNEAKKSLSGIARVIKELPNTVFVEGHTDNIPITVGRFSSNFELSADRAFSVVQYFIEEEKIAPKRFTVYGYGEFRPVDTNDTETGRAKNRRIEISIMRK